MQYKNPKLIYYYVCVFCSIPRLFVYLRMRMSTSKQHSCVRGPFRECRSIRSGASGLPYYCAPLVCVSDVMMMIAFITIKSSLVPLIEGLCAQIHIELLAEIELLAVWRHNKPKTKQKNAHVAEKTETRITI